MNVEQLTEYCLAKQGVTEGFPFGEDTLVFKVVEKIFALCGLENNPARVNLKCDPEKAEELRETYDEITPGYHMNKKHWNTIIIEGSLDESLIKKLIDHSYDLVVASLPKKEREALQLL